METVWEFSKDTWFSFCYCQNFLVGFNVNYDRIIESPSTNAHTHYHMQVHTCMAALSSKTFP